LPRVQQVRATNDGSDDGSVANFSYTFDKISNLLNPENCSYMTACTTIPFNDLGRFSSRRLRRCGNSVGFPGRQTQDAGDPGVHSNGDGRRWVGCERIGASSPHLSRRPTESLVAGRQGEQP
jgi:hypothetical protein